MNYYYLFPISRNPATPDPAWLAEARMSHLCKGCGSFPRGTKALDVLIQCLPDKSAMNTVYGVYVCFAATELLGALCNGEMNRFFRLGRVLDSEHKEISGVATFMCQSSLIVRGNEKSSFRICPSCSRCLYSAVGNRYVLRRDVQDAAVVEDQKGCLVVSESVVQRLKERVWKNLGIKKLEVRDEPVDGLAVNA